MQEKRPVTAKDIARECGISQATVSYVINNTPGKNISEKTRALVLETANRMRYFPNSAARGMRTRSSRSVGVVVGRNNVNIGFNHVLRGVKRVLDEAGYTILLLHDQPREEGKAPEYIGHYRASRIDGMLFSFCDLDPEEIAALQENAVPYVMLNENGVWLDGQEQPQSLREAFHACAALCREKELAAIKYFSFQYGQKTFTRKYSLFHQALLREFPRASLERVFIQAEGRDSADIGRELYQIVRDGGFDLAVTPHQRLGMLVQSAIMHNRLALPQFPKHICLDAAHTLQVVYPTVTSLDIPLTDIGGYGARQLLRAIAGQPFEDRAFACALKPGDSTE